jgi:hypothetical protein
VGTSGRERPASLSESLQLARAGFDCQPYRVCIAYEASRLGKRVTHPRPDGAFQAPRCRDECYYLASLPGRLRNPELRASVTTVMRLACSDMRP